MKQLLNWFRFRKLDSDFARELDYHFDRRVSDLLLTGISEAEAKRQARLELGAPQLREEVRDIWLTRWLRDFVYDLRFSLRSFVRNPTFTVTAMLSLALGIGPTTAIYSLADQIVLRALPVAEPERLVLIDWIGEQAANGRGSYNLLSYPICRDLQQQEHFFSAVFCRHMTEVNLSTGSEARPVGAEIVSPSYFAALGVGPALGRVISNEDDGTAGTNPVVVVSHDFWRNDLGSDPGIVGRKVLMNKHPMTVIGVAAPSFRGVDVGEVPAIWIPASMTTQAIPGWAPLTDRRSRWMQVMGRLRTGVTAASAQAGLQPWFKAMLEEDTRREGFPRISAAQRAKFLASRLEITAARHGHAPLRRRLTEPLWVLLAGTALLLALACLNVAGLFLARGSAREHEISTRLALGASRARVGRQLVADSLVLAFGGGLFGVLAAPLALRALIEFLPKNAAGNSLQSNVDLRALLITLALSILAGVLSGLGPALQTGRGSLITSLRERGGTVLGGARLRKILLTAQLAFTLVLLVGAALFMRTLNGLLQKGPGFSTSSLVAFSIEPRRSGYSPAEASRLTGSIHERIRNVPSVESASMAGIELLRGGSWSNPMTIQAKERITTETSIHMNSVSPEFFSTLGAKIVAGRDFDQRDTMPPGPDALRPAIVNEAFAKRYLAGRNPLGTLAAIGRTPGVRLNFEIVGVVSNISYRGVREENEQAYFPLVSGVDSGNHFYIRVRGTPATVFSAIREVVREADPALPITSLRTLDEQVSRSLSTERMLATVSGGFGTLALMLSLVGLYGVMSFVVTQRTREIGVRLALGATQGLALWLVLRDAAKMIGAGVVIALPCVWMLGRLIEAQLFGVTATDGATVLGAALVLLVTGFGAALIPASRAARIDPADALRSE